MITLSSCSGDPPAEGFLVFSVESVDLSGTELEGLISFTLRSNRVDVVIRDVADDPSTEQVVTILEGEREFEFTGVGEGVPVQLGRLSVPVGFVSQIRLITQDITMILDEELLTVKLPSGPQTGLKIVPDTLIEIVEGEVAGVKAIFDPSQQMHFAPGQGWILQPTMSAENIDPTDIVFWTPDEIIVQFRPELTREAIDAINATQGTTIAFDGGSNFFILKLPENLSIEDAYNFYKDHESTRFTMPDYFVNLDQVVPIAAPNDPNFINQWPLTTVQARRAWSLTTGSRDVTVAIVDSGADLEHQDLVNNLWLNEGELPPVLTQDANGDGLMDGDLNGDGVITCADFNLVVAVPPPGFGFQLQTDPGAQAILLAAGINDFNGNGYIDGTDILQTAGGDQVPDPANDPDDDGNGFIDDLVGWDFANNDNDPMNNVTGSHGTAVAGVTGAGGNNGMNLSGINWLVRIVPVQALPTGGLGQNSAAFLATRYAIQMGFDIINASWGMRFATPAVGQRGCGNVNVFVNDKRFNATRNALQNAWGTLNFNNVLFVDTVVNCSIDEDVGGYLDWPAHLAAPTQIRVTSTNNADTVVQAFGPNTVDIAAPSDGIPVLDPIVGVRFGIRGTSFAAPLVSGVGALLLANNPALTPVNLRNQILNNTDTLPATQTGLVNNNRRLNACRALNQGGC